MKKTEIQKGKTYANKQSNPKGKPSKWYQERTVIAVDGDVVSYRVTAGRDLGREVSITRQGMALWADSVIDHASAV